ncbi:MAG TPA: type I DNA topoisomerase [Candidatus Saccharimonadales bacterium]|nr:type I DNA topoisomerase [Candidatus Saccharimonadales bacterium]
MAKNVIIVESPSKAKTIERFLGKDFDVLSSVGHIRDIPTKKTKGGKPPIDIAHGFEPTYEIDPEKKAIIADLKKAIKGNKKVYLATDGDREGEAIAWHLTQVLGLDPKTTPRIVVHEITKPAIEEALEHPRTIDFDLVDAQQARRILDRLVGFELSPVVQRKVPGGRSAGRVQSPAVRLIVERENEIKDFKPEISYKTTADFVLKTKDALPAELNTKFDTEKKAQTFLEALKGATFTISDIATTPGTRNPNAPFTTSTLQQEAASRLGYSVKRTMTAAQRLYQAGKITYMRTDSVNLSPIAIKAMQEYIAKEYGQKYSQTRVFKTKSINAQEAHEAIRPVDVKVTHASDDATEQKLYDLIRRRTLASQMTPAQLERTTITITISTRKELFEAKGEIVLFDGFLKVYGDIIKKEEVLLPKIQVKEKISLKEAVSRQIFSRPPARYTEGSLVKKLEELGIGRPSTYATIISTIQTREYVTKGISEGVERPFQQLIFRDGTVTTTTEVENTGSDKGKLIPTASGSIVNGFLNDHFDKIVDYDFTADVEEEFDKIADGKEKREAMLKAFYGPFHKTIEAAGELTRAETTKTRELGKDPKTGRIVSARLGRFGPMVQAGESEDEEKPHFASIPPELSVDTITLEQALELLVLPRTVGKSPSGDDVIVTSGRFGPYARVGKETVSLKDEDPYTVDLETVLEHLKAKEELQAQRVIADFGKIKILRGRFGPYVTDGTKNAHVPKETDPEKITEKEAAELLKDAKAAPKKRTRRRAKSTTKSKK